MTIKRESYCLPSLHGVENVASKCNWAPLCKLRVIHDDSLTRLISHSCMHSPFLGPGVMRSLISLQSTCICL